MATQDNELTRPSHYRPGSPFEPIKIIEHYGLDFCLGNAIKYILRAGNKASETREDDLQKAAWYAARAVEKQQSMQTQGLEHLSDLFDEDSYFQGMQDSSSSPSAVMRAIIYALQESDFEERFVAESDLEIAPTKAVEVERVKLYGEPGFVVKVISLLPRTKIHYGDPGDEHVDRQG